MSDSPEPAGSQPHTTPRWVKVSAIIALIVLVLLVILILVSGPGGHGPDRHLSLGGGTSASGVTQPLSDTPPAGIFVRA